MPPELIITVFAVVATNLGTIVALYMHMDKKLDAHRKESHDILKGIADEMKDFHGRLERIDAEFKAHTMHYHMRAKNE